MNYKGYRKNYTFIPYPVMIHFHMQRFTIIGFMVIEVRFFKKKKKKMKENMAKLCTHVLHHQPTNFCILFIFHTFFTLIPFKVKSN